ncbi:carboxylesterase/lipase family protein [Leifsonia sp. F6_8S_P_1B]|uniref:Carboxylic ester hydrolase n=1 Tax=Leifsonia williamsii TaxID=3035919 RepID=A0ABT8KI95_9MICO|nr:carboxylesterase/lipase family protein [Leifsonia williamsii]MDN4616019.1 carboxylesterase/lipase family protein [Leifsonia williamsii]
MSSGSEHPVVETRSGAVRGTDDGRTAVWRGLRYAEPPVGPLRWRAPVPAAPWSGVADATAFGGTAPQIPNPAVPQGPARQDEDCLFLNVWRPSLREALPGAPRPVMVWIHGGAYTLGSASQPIYDGSRLVEVGDVVLVTLNYRLGALGFLDLSNVVSGGRSGEFDTNPALRDVLLALAWVRDNIAAFGGDPDRVTVFGQSAGGGIIAALLASPAAAGLFHRAIVQSAPATSMYGPERATAVARRFLEAADATGATPDDLRALPVDTVLRAAASAYTDVPREHPGTLAFAPSVDGDLLPEAPIAVLSAGRGHPVPLVIGSNRDEATLFRVMRSSLLPLTRRGLDAMFARMLEENPGVEAPKCDQVLAAYAGLPRRAVGVGMATDIAFRMPAVWIAEGHSAVAPTHLYRFDHATPLLRLAGVGAAHASDLYYVWGNLEATPRDPSFRLGGKAEARRVTRRVQERWTAFAHGRPPGTDWPAYRVPERETLVIGSEDRVVRDLDAARLAGWGATALTFR